MTKIYIIRKAVILSVLLAAVIMGVVSCNSNHDQNDSEQTDLMTCDSQPRSVDTIRYSRPATVDIQALRKRKFSEFDSIFGQYVYEKYRIYLTDWFKGERKSKQDKFRRKQINGYGYVKDMNLNRHDTVRILIAKHTGQPGLIVKFTNYVFKGSRDSIFSIRNERSTVTGYYDVGDKRYVYRMMHLRRSVPYRLMMQDSIDKLPRRFWKPLVPGDGDAFAVKLYIEDRIILRAEVTHFYDVLVDKAFECPDDLRDAAARGYDVFPEGSPEWEYLNKYEPGEKELQDSLYRYGYSGCLNSIFIADTIK